MFGLLAVSLIVVAVAQTRTRWYPFLDQAMIELLVRDVGGADSPTTGLVGRFAIDGTSGDHPGPLSWYLLAPIYRLLGSSADALTIANVVLEITAVALLIWVVARRGRPGLVVAFGLAAMVLLRAYGTVVLAQVWNPHLPLLWWLTAVAAAWVVVDGDRAMILVVAVAGAVCMQTHISYGIPVAGLSVFVVGWLVVDAVRRPALRRSDLTWLGVAAGVVIVLWTPVFVDELAQDPGNLTLLWRYFTTSEVEPLGVTDGLAVVLRHLDPWRLVTGELWGDGQTAIAGVPGGSVVPGAAVLVAWCAAVVIGSRLDDRSLRRFHATVAAVVVSSAIAVMRIIPPVWYWVTMFLWVAQAVVVLAVAWTAVAWVRERLISEPAEARYAVARTAALALVVAVGAVFVAETVTGPRLQDHPAARQLAALTPPAIAALTDGSVPGGGRDGVYRVRWSDPTMLGIAGFGLVDELERAGLEVGADPVWAPQLRRHRVLEAGEATADVSLVGGVFIDRALAVPGAVEVARFDDRTPAEVAEFEASRAQVIDELRRIGREDLIPAVDENVGPLVFGSAGPRVAELAAPLNELGVAMAIVVSPPPP